MIKYIVDNNINSGSIIKIAKSGGVIPFIVEVIEQSKTPGLPKDIKYKWNKTKVDIVIDKETAEIKRIQTIKNLTTREEYKSNTGLYSPFLFA